jgi:anti-sigma B factor antagonist
VDVSNAGQIREDLLSVINRGAKELIADMTATVSCDHAGAGAVVRAHQRAVVSGAELRLVVTAQIVSRVLSTAGVDRLVSVYPSLEAAMAASAPARVLTLVAGPAGTGADGQPPPPRAGPASRPVQATGPADGGQAAITPAGTRELLDTVITSLSNVGLSLRAAADLPAEATRQRIAEAIGHLDEIIREIRGAAFAHRGHDTAQQSRPSAASGDTLARKDRTDFSVRH